MQLYKASSAQEVLIEGVYSGHTLAAFAYLTVSVSKPLSGNLTL